MEQLEWLEIYNKWTAKKYKSLRENYHNYGDVQFNSDNWTSPTGSNPTPVAYLRKHFLLFYLNDFQVANSGVHVGVVAHVGHTIVSGKADNEQAKCMLVIT